MNLPRRLLLRLTSSRWTQPAIPRASAVAALAAVLLATTVASTCLRAAAPTQPQRLERWEAAYLKYRAEGKTANVLKLLQNMRQHLRRTGEVDTETYGKIAFYLAVYLRDIGPFEEARAAYGEAATVAEHLHGTNSRERLRILNYQADLLVKQKDYAEAEIMCRDVLRQMEAALGPDDGMTADALETLTLARLELKKYDECEADLQRILRIRERTNGKNGYLTGVAWINLGTFYLEMGRVPEARRALMSGAKMMLAVGSDVFERKAVFNNLTRLEIDSGSTRRALLAANQVFLGELKLIRDVFPTLAENERLNLVGRLEPVRWFATIGDAERIATATLQTKAITLDQLLAQSAPAAAESDPFSDLLQPEFAAQGLVPYAAPAAAGGSGARRVTQSRVKLNFRVTPSQVCGALPAGTALVEFVRYNRYVGRFKDEAHYGALVFVSRQQPESFTGPELAWVPLGAAEPIDQEITALDAGMLDPVSAGLTAARLRTLYGLVWAPLAQALPAGTENVFVCPDGQTCFLPFGALLDPEGRFLADKQLVMYLSTARDLFRMGEEKTVANRDFAIFAAPTYGQVASAGTNAESRFRDVDARSLSGLQLTDLPGSRAEAAMLQTLASQQRFQPNLFLGEAANKENVEAMHQPRVVHFATHGFFLPPAADGPAGNPMDRSGLALAGAQVTLKAMAEGRVVPAAANDGLLTAREVARLPLSGTWIATLSACDTGRGEARDGEGVLGLRRGFLAAGVQNLMISLWNISDLETVAFMRDFYTRALESSDPAMALALTQREWLARLRKEHGIAAAVSTAGAFVLNTSGRLPIPAGNLETK